MVEERHQAAAGAGLDDACRTQLFDWQHCFPMQDHTVIDHGCGTVRERQIHGVHSVLLGTATLLHTVPLSLGTTTLPQPLAALSCPVLLDQVLIVLCGHFRRNLYKVVHS